MATWQGIGMNYGHQTQVATSSYSTITTQVENDYAYLQSVGVTRLRIAMPQFDSTVSLPNCQDLVTRALAHKFYVVWGVVAGFGSSTLTATRWASAKTYIVNTLAPWAQSNGLSELNLTNESELAVDGTTLTAATVRADIRSMATTIKGNGFTGKVTYSTSVLSTYRTPWANEGIGDLDYIAWNSYDTLTNFNANKPVIVSQFGSSNTYISEFGSITNGQSDYANETAYYTDVLGRVKSIRNAGIPYGYFFCYRDGAFGMPVNSFGLVQTTTTGNLGGNWAHYALRAVTGTRLYALRTFGRPTQFGIAISAPPSESVSLSEASSPQGSTTIASESVSVSETLTQMTGLPSPSDAVSIDEAISSSNTIQISAESVSLNEASSLSNAIQISAESVSIAENTSLTGQAQSTDSVQLAESNPSLQSSYTYAPRVFGSPVRYGLRTGTLTVPADSVSLSESIISRKKYALRVFGSTIKIGVVANTLSISETASLSEIVTLSSTTTLSAESVSIAESPALTGAPTFNESVQVLESATLAGQSQLIDNVQLLERLGVTRYALRVFGSPVQHSVAGSAGSMSVSDPSISTAESISLTAIENIAADLVQILEALSAAGLPSFTDTVQANDATPSQASATIASESVSLSELPTQSGSSSLQAEPVSLGDTTTQSSSVTISDSAQVSEQTVFAASTSFIEQTTISDVFALLGLPQFSESVQVGEGGVSQVGQSQLIDNVQLLESGTFAGTSTQASESALITELMSLTGLPQLVENVQLSDALTSLFGSLSNIIQIKKYALRTFGAPVKYGIALVSTDTISLKETSTQIGSASISESASLQEMLSLAGTDGIAPETVSVSDISAQTGLPTFVESISLNDALSSLINSSSIIEIAPLSESAFFAGSSQIIEIAPISELLSLLGIDQITDDINLSELISEISFPNTNATFYIRKGNVAFYTRKGNVAFTIRR